MFSNEKSTKYVVLLYLLVQLSNNIHYLVLDSPFYKKITYDCIYVMT
jgi:hypothetical protein